MAYKQILTEPSISLGNGPFCSPGKDRIMPMNFKREHLSGTSSHGQIPASRAKKFFKHTPPPLGQKTWSKSQPPGKFFIFFNTVIVIHQPMVSLLIWGGVFCVGGKNMNFYVKKSNQVATYRQI